MTELFAPLVLPKALGGDALLSFFKEASLKTGNDFLTLDLLLVGQDPNRTLGLSARKQISLLQYVFNRSNGRNPLVRLPIYEKVVKDSWPSTMKEIAEVRFDSSNTAMDSDSFINFVCQGMAHKLIAAGANPWLGFDMNSDVMPSEIKSIIDFDDRELFKKVFSIPGAPSYDDFLNKEWEVNLSSKYTGWQIISGSHKFTNRLNGGSFSSIPVERGDCFFILESLLKSKLRPHLNDIQSHPLVSSNHEAIRVFQENDAIPDSKELKDEVVKRWSSGPALIKLSELELMEFQEVWARVEGSEELTTEDLIDIHVQKWMKFPALMHSESGEIYKNYENRILKYIEDYKYEFITTDSGYPGQWSAEGAYMNRILSNRFYSKPQMFKEYPHLLEEFRGLPQGDGSFTMHTLAMLISNKEGLPSESLVPEDADAFLNYIKYRVKHRLFKDRMDDALNITYSFVKHYSDALDVKRVLREVKEVLFPSNKKQLSWIELASSEKSFTRNPFIRYSGNALLEVSAMKGDLATSLSQRDDLDLIYFGMLFPDRDGGSSIVANALMRMVPIKNEPASFREINGISAFWAMENFEKLPRFKELIDGSIPKALASGEKVEAAGVRLIMEHFEKLNTQDKITKNLDTHLAQKVNGGRF